MVAGRERTVRTRWSRDLTMTFADIVERVERECCGVLKVRNWEKEIDGSLKEVVAASRDQVRSSFWCCGDKAG